MAARRSGAESSTLERGAIVWRRVRPRRGCGGVRMHVGGTERGEAQGRARSGDECRRAACNLVGERFGGR